MFVPGYGACGQLYSPEVAAMIYPIPHILLQDDGDTPPIERWAPLPSPQM